MLKKTLETELAKHEAEHEKALKVHAVAVAAYPEKVLAEVDKFRNQVLKGKVPIDDYGKVRCGLSQPPIEPDADCRTYELKECLRVLALSADPEFRLSDDSKFFRYACEVRKPARRR